MNTEDLILKIESLRGKMISVGMTKGFSSPETIKLSQTLDKLLNLQLGLTEKIFFGIVVCFNFIS